MKLVVIGLAATLLLGGGAAGAYFFFDKPAAAASGPLDEAAKAEHDAKIEAAAEGHDEEGAPKEEFVAMDALILPVIDDSGVTHTVSLVISLEVPDSVTAEEVKRLSPRLKDAYIQDMYGVLNRKSAMKNGVLKVSTIKQRLNLVSEKILGKGKINDVLLQVVQQRAL